MWNYPPIIINLRKVRISIKIDFCSLKVSLISSNEQDSMYFVYKYIERQHENTNQLNIYYEEKHLGNILFSLGEK